MLQLGILGTGFLQYFLHHEGWDRPGDHQTPDTIRIVMYHIARSKHVGLRLYHAMFPVIAKYLFKFFFSYLTHEYWLLYISLILACPM